jgi:hypothetical protein
MEEQTEPHPSVQGETDTSMPITASGGGMFKKRAKFGSAQTNLRKPVSVSAPTSKTKASDDESDESELDDEGSFRPPGITAGRKRKRGGLVQAATSRKVATDQDEGVTYDVSNPDARLDPRSQATATSAEFSDADLLGHSNTATTTSASGNLYRGQKAYQSLLPQREQITTKYNPVGPQKAASNVRMTTYVDYAPGVSSPILAFALLEQILIFSRCVQGLQINRILRIR